MGQNLIPPRAKTKTKNFGVLTMKSGEDDQRLCFPVGTHNEIMFSQQAKKDNWSESPTGGGIMLQNDRYYHLKVTLKNIVKLSQFGNVWVHLSELATFTK